MTIAPFMVTSPEAENSAVAVPFIVIWVWAVPLTDKPESFRSLVAETLIAAVAVAFIFWLAFSIISEALCMVIPEEDISILFPFWSVSVMDLASSLSTIELLAGVIKVSDFLSSSITIFTLFLLT